MPRQRKPPKNTVTVEFDARIALPKIAGALKDAGILLYTHPTTWKLYAVEVAVKEVKQS